MDIKLELPQSNPQREDYILLIIGAILNDAEQNIFHPRFSRPNCDITRFYACVRDVSDSLRYYESDSDDSSVEKIIKSQNLLKLPERLNTLSKIVYDLTGYPIHISITDSKHSSFLRKQFTHDKMTITFTE